jgi:hypothetical protein
MKLIPLSEQATKARERLRYEPIAGVPARGQNEEDHTDDPSGLSKLQLVGRHHEVGTGHGPEIEKVAVQRWGAALEDLSVKLAEVMTRQPLSPGLAALYDNDKYMATGAQVPVAPFRVPAGAPDWQPHVGNLPFIGTSAFQLARDFRNRLQGMQMPDVVRESTPLRTLLGAGTGAALAAGAGWVKNLLDGESTPLSHFALPAAGLGAWLGHQRGAFR